MAETIRDVMTSNPATLRTNDPALEAARAMRDGDFGAVVVVDGAQSAPHLRVDLQAIDCDFFACSGHKLYGPTGIGLLYGKKALLEAMPPWQGGGGMIREVQIDRSTYAPPPERFEAGTPPIAEVIGLGATLDYVSAWDWDALVAYEQEIVAEATRKLSEVPGLRILGEGAVELSAQEPPRLALVG